MKTLGGSTFHQEKQVKKKKTPKKGSPILQLQMNCYKFPFSMVLLNDEINMYAKGNEVMVNVKQE